MPDASPSSSSAPSVVFSVSCRAARLLQARAPRARLWKPPVPRQLTLSPRRALFVAARGRIRRSPIKGSSLSSSRAPPAPLHLPASPPLSILTSPAAPVPPRSPCPPRPPLQSAQPEPPP